jgi:RNA polymerase sigma-70 factor (ECF subfamily)
MGSDNKLVQQQRFQQLVADDLVRAAQAGDMLAHSQLYKMFSQAVMTLARGFCKNNAAAEDVVHNTFIKLIDKITTFEFRAPFGMWLRQITVTESLMYLRKQKKHSWVSTDEYAFFDTCDETEESLPLSSGCEDFVKEQGIKHELSDVLRDLPEHVRLILWLKEIEGYTHNEIAELLGKTPSYSKSVVARSYKVLRDKVQLQRGLAH